MDDAIAVDVAERSAPKRYAVIAIDTNVLVRLFVNDDIEQTKKSMRLV